VVVAIAIGAYLVQLGAPIFYTALSPAAPPPGGRQVPLPALSMIAIALGTGLASGVAGALAALLAPDRRKLHVQVVAAIILVFTARMALGAGIPTAVRLQSLFFSAACVAGCLVLGLLMVAYLGKRGTRGT
jgi:hypothetical protein